MAKKINEKTSGISLAGFQPRTSPIPAKPDVISSRPDEQIAHREQSKSYTGAGIFLSAITGRDDLAKDLAEVQSKLADAKREVDRFAGADVVRTLDPVSIRASHWANRNEASFRSKDFDALKLEIENSGGNVQPIKVRPLAGVDGQFEIVYGHRRHRACLQLGLPVKAQIEQLSDAELFAQMDRENRQRADLRPYEQGVMYAKALDEGLFPSLRKMAETLGVDAGNASKAIALARLPVGILAAFDSPLDLQQAWATPLSAALQKAPDVVLSRARILANTDPKPAAAKVFKDLVGGGVVSNNTPNPAVLELKGRAGKSGKITFNAKTQQFEISLVGLDIGQIQAVEKAIKSLLS